MLYFIFSLIFCFTIWFGYTFTQYSKFILYMKRVKGIIQEVVYDRDIEFQFSASFAYEYEVSGKIYSSPIISIGRGERCSNNLVNLSKLRNKYSEGNEIKVVYNRKDPEMSEVLDGLFFLKAVLVPFIFISLLYISSRLFDILFL